MKEIRFKNETSLSGKEYNSPPISRRDALRIGLASAALFAISGCAIFGGSKTDLDKALSTLQKTLEGFGEDEVRQSKLISIARRIENRCRELIQEHEEFSATFEKLSIKRETTSGQLNEFVDGFTTRRTEQRNAILRLQDDLRLELSEEEWIEAVRALNSTQEAMARPRAERS